MLARSEIYAVLIALKGDTLLLPNAAVADVLPHGGLQPAAAGPEWWVGSFLWSGRKLAVVSFEAMNGGRKAELTTRSRLIVLQPFGSAADRPIALLGQGYPHLVTLNRIAVRKQPLTATDREDLVLARVRIANTEAVVPDLEAIEKSVNEAHVAQAA